MERIVLPSAVFLVLMACGPNERPAASEPAGATPVIADASIEDASQAVMMGAPDASLADASDASFIDPALFNAAHELVLVDVKLPKADGVVAIKSLRVSRNLIPAEIVIRIVRQNLGRFRLCLERLSERPTVHVIDVTTFFAIAKTGDSMLVRTVAAPNEELAHCVRNGFTDLDYPQPDPPLMAVELTLRFDVDALPAHHGAPL